MKCFISCFSFTIIALVSKTAPEGVCESCVPIDMCPMLASLTTADYRSLVTKYPCSNNHPDEYGIPPGISETARGNMICCPNKIWGINGNAQRSNTVLSNRITESNQFDYDTSRNFGDPYVYQDPRYYHYERNQNNYGSDNYDVSNIANNGYNLQANKQNGHSELNYNNRQNPNYYGLYDESNFANNGYNLQANKQQNGYSDQNYYNNAWNQNNYGSHNYDGSNIANYNLQANIQSGPVYQNQNTGNKGYIEPTRLATTNKNKYWNDRPDKTKWDIGNKNFYQGNNRGSENRYNFGNNQFGKNNNVTNRAWQRPGGYYPNTNNQGADRFQNNNRRNQNRQNGNTVTKGDQCDAVTRFPPNPETGCCGRDASDDDRITGTPFKLSDSNQLVTKLTKTIDDAPSNNFAQASQHNCQEDHTPERLPWSSKLKDDVKSRWGPNFYKTQTSSNINFNGIVRVENRIAGGNETELTQYPWTALLVSTFDNGLQRTSFNCGGSLISSRYILTAAHCVYGDEAVLRSVQVFLAEYDKRTFPLDCKTTPDGQKCIENLSLFAEDVIVHPQFNETRLLNDIALIRLQQNAPYTEYIRPICLPSINIDNPEHSRLPLRVTGWGRDGPYKTDIKQSTTVQLVPQKECRRFYPDLTPRHLCAAGFTGQDTCKGDSGGPLMTLYRGRYYVEGVVSGKRTDAPCGSAVPSLYTNVYHYLDWIRSNVRN